MGQQQLLLIILGVIIVGIAVAVGITMFQDNALDQNRNMVLADLSTLAAKAQQFYVKPISLGGGGNSFVGLAATAAGVGLLASTAFTNSPSNAVPGLNANGDYTISTAGSAANVVLTGVGRTLLPDGATYPTYTMTVTASGQVPVKVN